MVKLALISDIHGNYKALEALLEYLEKHPVDGILCLGDYVTDAPYPERIMELLYQLRKDYTCYMIRGNREDYLLDNMDNHENWKPSSANGALFYTMQHLTKQDMDFFASLPTEKEVRLEGLPALYLCHGTPGKVRGNVTQEEGLRQRALAGLNGSYLLGGHSHHQEIYRQTGKTYINPGSLGLAIDGMGRRAQFAVLTGRTSAEVLQERWAGVRPVCAMDSFTEDMPFEKTAGEWEARLLSISYDVDSYLEAFAESGLDEIGMFWSRAVRKTLVTGINYCYDGIVAMENRARRAGIGSLAQIPEQEWRKLEREFGL